MLARCSLCEKTFVTNQFGRQRCPKCGGEVFVSDPRQPEGEENAYAPPSAPAGAYNEAAFDAPGVPWDRRAELGTWKALVETMKLVLSEPGAFFERVRPERTDGLHLFFLLVGVVPGVLSAILGRLMSNPADQARQMITLYRQMGQEEAARFVEKLEPILNQSASTGAFLGSLLLVPVIYFFGLYFFAGVAHLVLKLLGKGSNGWNGTFAAFVYASAPLPLLIVPGCGWLIAGTWATALQIIGLGRVQRVTTGIATASVLSFHALAACCGCGLGVAAATMVAAVMQQGGQF